MGRELTRKEKAAIRSLVVKWCANYDREYGCLPLECECYMFGKCWTGSFCRYFREAVLPLDPALEAALLTEGPRPDFKLCPVCGGAVAPDRRQAYCSEACALKAHRRQQREYMRKKRGPVNREGRGPAVAARPRLIRRPRTGPRPNLETK